MESNEEKKKKRGAIILLGAAALGAVALAKSGGAKPPDEGTGDSMLEIEVRDSDGNVMIPTPRLAATRLPSMRSPSGLRGPVMRSPVPDLPDEMTDYNSYKIVENRIYTVNVKLTNKSWKGTLENPIYVDATLKLGFDWASDGGENPSVTPASTSSFDLKAFNLESEADSATLVYTIIPKALDAYPDKTFKIQVRAPDNTIIGEKRVEFTVVGVPVDIPRLDFSAEIMGTPEEGKSIALTVTFANTSIAADGGFLPLNGVEVYCYDRSTGGIPPDRFTYSPSFIDRPSYNLTSSTPKTAIFTVNIPGGTAGVSREVFVEAIYMGLVLGVASFIVTPVAGSVTDCILEYFELKTGSGYPITPVAGVYTISPSTSYQVTTKMTNTSRDYLGSMKGNFILRYSSNWFTIMGAPQYDKAWSLEKDISQILSQGCVSRGLTGLTGETGYINLEVFDLAGNLCDAKRIDVKKEAPVDGKLDSWDLIPATLTEGEEFTLRLVVSSTWLGLYTLDVLDNSMGIEECSFEPASQPITFNTAGSKTIEISGYCPVGSAGQHPIQVILGQNHVAKSTLTFYPTVQAAPVTVAAEITGAIISPPSDPPGQVKESSSFSISVGVHNLSYAIDYLYGKKAADLTILLETPSGDGFYINSLNPSSRHFEIDETYWIGFNLIAPAGVTGIKSIRAKVLDSLGGTLTYIDIPIELVWSGTDTVGIAILGGEWYHRSPNNIAEEAASSVLELTLENTSKYASGQDMPVSGIEVYISDSLHKLTYVPIMQTLNFVSTEYLHYISYYETQIGGGEELVFATVDQATLDYLQGMYTINIIDSYPANDKQMIWFDVGYPVGSGGQHQVKVSVMYQGQEIASQIYPVTVDAGVTHYAVDIDVW